MGKSVILLCLILLSTRLAARMGSKRFNENTIKVDSAECEVSGVVMICDYKGLKEEPLYMEPLQNLQIQMVFLSNIKDLYLDECLSVDLSVTNIQRVSIKPSGNFNCPKFELSAKYSNLNEIPKAVSQLYLEECDVEMIQPKVPLSKLLVISSKVQQLDVAIPLVNGTVAVMHSSRITHLKHFTMDSGSTLLIKETTIDSVYPEAIDLRDGKIIVENSILNRAEASKDGVLGSGVTYQIEGTMTMTPFNNTEVFDRLEQVSYFNLFCVFLVLFFVTSIAFCAYIFRREPSLRKPKKGPNLEIDGYSRVPAEEDKVIDSDNKTNSTTEIDLKKIIDEIKKEFEGINLNFEKEKLLHSNKIKDYDKEIDKTKENYVSASQIMIKKINEYFSYLDILENTKDSSLTLLGRLTSEASEEKIYEAENEKEGQTNFENKDSLSTAKQSQWKNLQDTFVNCESQINQTLSHLEGPNPEKKTWKSYLLWSQTSTPKDTTLLRNIPQHMKKHYTEFWKSIKHIEKFNNIFKYTDAEVNEALFRSQLSTLEILVSIQEENISNMKKYMSSN